MNQKNNLLIDVLEQESIVVLIEDDLFDEMDSTHQFLNFYRKFMTAFMKGSEI